MDVCVTIFRFSLLTFCIPDVVVLVCVSVGIGLLSSHCAGEEMCSAESSVPVCCCLVPPDFLPYSPRGTKAKLNFQNTVGVKPMAMVFWCRDPPESANSI